MICQNQNSDQVSESLVLTSICEANRKSSHTQVFAAATAGTVYPLVYQYLSAAFIVQEAN